MVKYTTVAVQEETRKRLIIMKEENEFSSVDRLINKMMKNYEENDD